MSEEQGITAALAAYIAAERLFLADNPHVKRITVECKNGIFIRVSRKKVHLKGADDKGWFDASVDFPPETSS